MLSVNKLTKGFTLVELLVVVALIGILTAVGLASFITAQKQTRDARRRQDIKAIQAAMEQYRSENGTYPTANPGLAFESGVQPADPKDSDPYVYTWNIEDASYCICADLETGTGNAADTGSTAGCNWTGPTSYFCVQNQQ